MGDDVRRRWPAEVSTLWTQQIFPFGVASTPGWSPRIEAARPMICVRDASQALGAATDLLHRHEGLERGVHAKFLRDVVIFRPWKDDAHAFASFVRARSAARATFDAGAASVWMLS